MTAVEMQQELTGDVSAINVIPTGSSQGSTARNLVQELRDQRPAYRSYVTGQAAFLIDVFVFAFGLSMDYEVFLLSRIKECYDECGNSNDAVANRLQRSGRIITSAALLVIIVFLGFAAGQTLGIKEMGLALAIAVAIDATLVRCLLVPATMRDRAKVCPIGHTLCAELPSGTAARVPARRPKTLREPELALR